MFGGDAEGVGDQVELAGGVDEVTLKSDCTEFALHFWLVLFRFQ